MIQTYLSTAVLAAIFFFHCSVVLGKESQANFVIEPVQMGGGVAYDAIENDTVPVVYRLFTRSNPTEFQVLRLYDTDALLSSNFNPNRSTKIYGPGWGSDGVSSYRIRDEYLYKYDCNFIVIYWPDLIAQEGDGQDVVRTTQIAGNHTGAFIDFLIEYGAPLSSFHLIGHSAGAHVVGVAGGTVTYGKVARATGLDPVDGNVWQMSNPDTVLDITDAEFVDYIHTNGGEAAEGDVAYDEPLGHVDFYVNGGQTQPGCPEPDFICCSHCRTVDIFAESINTLVGFVSVRCDSYEEFLNGTCNENQKELMGDDTSTSARGTFYLNTNAEQPWALGDIY